MEEHIEEQMAEIVAEEATLQDQDSNFEEIDDEEYDEASDDEDMDDDDHNAASFLEVTLDPQQYARSSDTQEDGSEEEEDEHTKIVNNQPKNFMHMQN